jgi:hypothetical protein
MSLSDATRASLEAAKLKRGKPAPSLLEHQRATVRMQRKIREVLASEHTVPEIAELTGLDAAVVLFQVAAMRKYGKVEDAGKRGDYLCYRARKE